jgi:hypothetical protein
VCLVGPHSLRCGHFGHLYSLELRLLIAVATPRGMVRDRLSETLKIRVVGNYEEENQRNQKVRQAIRPFPRNSGNFGNVLFHSTPSL